MPRRRGKKTLRGVLWVDDYGGESRTGNPRNFRYLLECGHVMFTYYSYREGLRVMVFQHSRSPKFKGEPMKMRKHCVRCAVGRPCDPDEWVTGDWPYLTEAMKNQFLAHKPERRRRGRPKADGP